MYCLNRHNQLPLLSRQPDGEANRARLYANTLLTDSTAGLTFEPEEHKYFLGNNEIRCVSSIVEHFAPFDSLKVATGCSKNRKHEMYGKEPKEIVAIWKERGRVAAEAGTVVHEFGEACYLFKSGREEDIDIKYKDRMTAEGLMASSVKEEAMARWWDTLDLDRYVIVAKETRVVNPEFNYAGTFDLLLYDLREHYYVLRDYKTNGDLFRWYGDMLRAPLTPIRADDHGKYTLQQNLYRIQLENIGIHVGAMQLIWLRDDGQFQDVEIKNYDKLVRQAMSMYNNES